MERVCFLSFRGRQILFVDYSDLQNADEVRGVVETLKRTIREQPEGSVLLLTNLRGTKTDGVVEEMFKELVEHNKPYICASAVIGVGAVQRLVFEAARIFAGREIRTFTSMTKAKEWLVDQALSRPEVSAAETTQSV